MLSVALKDLKSVRREKTILLVIALLFFVASFSSLVVFGLTVLYSPSGYTNAVVGLVGKAPIFSSIVHPIQYDSLDKALSDLRNGKIDAVVVFNENVTGKNFITIYVPKEDLKAIKATLYLRKKLMEYQDVLRRMRGIPTLNLKVYEDGREIDVPEGYSIHFRFVYVMLIPLLAVTTAVISAAFLIDSICEEVETKTIEVLLTALDSGEIVSGKVLASLVLSIVLTAFWMVMLSINGFKISNPAIAFLICMAICALFTSLALIVSSLTMTREKAQLVFSILVISAIMLMFSDSSTPVGLLVRVSANSPFKIESVIAYFILSTLAMLIAILFADRRISKNSNS